MWALGVGRVKWLLCVTILTFAISNLIIHTTAFADVTEIRAEGKFIYGEDIKLSLTKNADSYYWDYLSNGKYFACSGDNEGQCYTKKADFVGKRSYRCHYELDGEVFCAETEVFVKERNIRFKLSSGEGYYGEDKYFELVVDSARDDNNLGLAFNDGIDKFGYTADLSDIGEHSIYAFSYSNCYKVFCDEIFTVKPRPIILGVCDFSVNYGDDMLPNLYVAEKSADNLGLVNGDNVSLFSNAIYFSIADGNQLGKQTIKGEIKTRSSTVGNYEIVSILDGTVDVRQKEITVSLHDGAVAYGEPIAATYSVEGLAATDSSDDITLNFFCAGKDVGQYTVSATAVSVPEVYSVKAINSALITIIPREVEYKVDATRIYGEDTVEIDLTYAGGSNEILEEDIGQVNIEAVFDGEIKCSATDKTGNYLINFSINPITVLPRDLTVELADIFLIYGETLPSVAVKSASGLVDGESLPRLEYTTEYMASGEYILTARAEPKENYNINVTDAELTVARRKITVAVDDKTTVYGGNDYQLTYSYFSDKPLRGDDLKIELYRDGGDTVGEYGIYGSYDNDNYDVTFVNGTYKIEKGYLNMGVSVAESFVYGATPETYAVGENEVRFIYFQNGEEVTRATVGECDVFGEFCGSELYNAGLQYLGVTDIIKRTITVTAQNATKQKYTPDGALRYEITDGRLLEGDTLSGSIARVEGEKLGDYAITRGTLDNANYEIIFIEGTFSIGANTVTDVGAVALAVALLGVGSTFLVLSKGMRGRVKNESQNHAIG